MNTIFSLNFFNFKVVSVMTRSWLFNISTRQPGIFRHLRHLHTRAHTGILLLCIRHLHPHESLHYDANGHPDNICTVCPLFHVRCVSIASKSSIRRFIITEKAPTRASSWLKAATTFTFKTPLRHYAKRALTPRSLNVKLGPRHNYHKGRAVWLA